MVFDRDLVIRELEENGYAVIPNVLSTNDCDTYIQEYKDFINQFEDKGTGFFNCESVIQTYRIGHFNATWQVRLKVKDVFANIWQTEKLLTSVDAVAISKPPEEGDNQFATPNQNWFHLDQGGQREGRHAYQGGVYLEGTTDKDHCFRVLTKSHKYHSEFYEEFPEAKKFTRDMEFYKLNKHQQEWYINKGCVPTKVPVPKGGIVLWDSRTVHDNARPEFGRPNADRWRFVVFVCMAPAYWANVDDLAKKHNAYKKLLMTTHWPSQGVSTFREYQPTSKKSVIDTVDTLPDIAKSLPAKQLMGIEPYDFDDDNPNGPEKPKWN